jgi:hypothetical protein
MEGSMNKAIVPAALLLLAGAVVPGATNAASLWSPEPTRPAALLPPLPPPPQQHTDVPPLPQGASGYAYDAQTGRWTAEGGKAIWVPGHWQSGDGGQSWVEGRWMYPKPPAEGFGGDRRPRR